MKLLIIFDDNVDIKDCSEEDIILCCSTNYLPQICCRIEYIDWNACNEDKNLSEAVRSFFNQLPNDWSFLMNSAYVSIFRPIAASIISIEKIIKENDVNEIIVFGGSRKPFISLTGTEGEGNKFLYQTSWMLSPIIYNYLSSKKCFEVRRIDTKAQPIISILHFFRENYLLLRIVCGEFKRHVKELNYNIQNYQDHFNLVAITELAIQTRHLSKLLSPLNENIVFISLDENDDSKVIHPKHLGVVDIFNIVRKGNNHTRYRSAVFCWNGVKISFSNNYLCRAFKVEKCNSLFKNTRIRKILDANFVGIKYVFTDMTVNGLLSLFRETANSIGAMHINYQYVGMGRILYPQLDLADKYFLTSPKTFELYKQYSDSFGLFIPLVDVQEKTMHPNTTVNLAIFTQPDIYTDKYITLIDQLLKRIDNDKININIIIKPHYRQDKISRFQGFSDTRNYVVIADPADSVKAVFQRADIILSMTSSVLFEAVLDGIPAIIADVDGSNAYHIDNSDVCLQEVNFRANSIDEIVRMILNIEALKSEYHIRRVEYFKRIRCITTIEDTLSDKEI